MNINMKQKNIKTYFLIFILMMLSHKIIFLFISISISYTNGIKTPIDDMMGKLIKLISEEQVN